MLSRVMFSSRNNFVKGRCSIHEKIVFVSGTFDLLNVMYRTALKPFLNGTKTVTLTVCVNEPFFVPFKNGFNAYGALYT